MRAAAGTFGSEGRPLEAVSADCSASAAAGGEGRGVSSAGASYSRRSRRTFDFAADEVRVELGLSDEKVELARLALALALLLLLLGPFKRLLLGPLAVLALILLIALPEHEHLRQPRRIQRQRTIARSERTTHLAVHLLGLELDVLGRLLNADD